FDDAFRALVRAAWVAIGQPAPASLADPIRGPRTPDRREPERLLPVDPADPGGFTAWTGAGGVRPRRGAMADGSGVGGLRFGWDRGGALWVRVDVREPGWRFDPLPDEVVPVLDGFVGRYTAGEAAVSVVHPAGVRWPDAPVVLAPPPHPNLRWWDV
ncbi:MAG: hypothetical protein ABMB14_28195, partial [Myxococcota bacterium]